MRRVCRIIVVGEGWRDSRFARSFFEAANIDPRKLETRVNPGGSGHDWVKREFVEAVAAVQCFREGRGVVGLLDEDGQGVAHRRGAVNARLTERDLPLLDAADGRCLLLPMRNLETWLYWLEGQRSGQAWPVDENTDYKHSTPAGIARLKLDDVCRPAGEYLHTLNHLAPPAGCPAMLADALQQLRHFVAATSRG